MENATEWRPDNSSVEALQEQLVGLETQLAAVYDDEELRYSEHTAEVSYRITKVKTAIAYFDESSRRYNSRTSRQFAPDISLFRAAGTIASSYVRPYFE